MISNNIKKHTFVEDDLITIDYTNNPVLWDEAWESVSDEYYADAQYDEWDVIQYYDYPF